MNDKERQKNIQSLLQCLARKLVSKEHLQEEIEKIKKIYMTENGEQVYRHLYSGISGYLYVLVNQGEDLDILQENFINIRESIYSAQYRDTTDKNFKTVFDKLYDHVMLESNRLMQLKIMFSQHDTNRAQLEQIFQELKVARKLSNEIEKENKKIKKELDKSTVSSITVLSIFTGVVMAFVGGFSILGSAFSNTELFQSRIWLLILLMSLVGFIFFNTVFMFIYMVAKLSNHNIAATCRVCTDTNCEQCALSSRCAAKCSGLKRFRRRYPYIVYVNVVLLVIIVATGLYGILTTVQSQQTPLPVNVMTEEQLSQTEQNLPNDFNLDIQLTNECKYEMQESSESTKTNPRTGD